MNELPRGTVSLDFHLSLTARGFLLRSWPGDPVCVARFALRRLEKPFVGEGGDEGESVTCVKWVGTCLQPSQSCFWDGRNECCLALMGSAGHVRGSG